MLVDIVRDGFKYRVQVPNDSLESTWQYGIVVGPPDLSVLGFDEETNKRLNNELFVRGLITEKDVRKRAHEVFGALQAALSVDVQTIMQAYANAKLRS